ncbi:hypothetical protein BCA37_11075 [Mycobacterium sp. djl-10]|nr:hypothetical protein BCA37_11075 [Mycobacterium sp. djl-10]
MNVAGQRRKITQLITDVPDSGDTQTRCLPRPGALMGLFCGELLAAVWSVRTGSVSSRPSSSTSAATGCGILGETHCCL